MTEGQQPGTPRAAAEGKSLASRCLSSSSCAAAQNKSTRQRPLSWCIYTGAHAPQGRTKSTTQRLPPLPRLVLHTAEFPLLLPTGWPLRMGGQTQHTLWAQLAQQGGSSTWRGEPRPLNWCTGWALHMEGRTSFPQVVLAHPSP